MVYSIAYWQEELMTLSDWIIINLPNLEIQSWVWVAFWETEHVTTHDRGACRQDQRQEILPPCRGLQYDQGGMLLQITFYDIKDTGVYFYYILSIEMYHLCNAIESLII